MDAVERIKSLVGEGYWVEWAGIANTVRLGWIMNTSALEVHRQICLARIAVEQAGYKTKETGLDVHVQLLITV